jgi:hypothetical protein
MTDDPDDGPDLSGVGWLNGWSLFSAAERAESAKAVIALHEAWKREDRRQAAKREIATLKALRKAGLPVRRAVVDGVTVELGEVEAETRATLTPLQAWRAKKNARRS